MGRHRLAEMIDEEQGEGRRPRRWSTRTVVAALGVTLGVLGAAAAWALASGDDGAAPRFGEHGPDTSTVVASASEGPVGIGAESASPTVSTSTSQPASPFPPGARFTADYNTASQWRTGFVGEVVVRNVGDGAARWTVEVTLPSGASVADAWNADYQRSGDVVRFFRSSELAPGASASFGFRIEAKSTVSGPNSCSINGQPCG